MKAHALLPGLGHWGRLWLGAAQASLHAGTGLAAWLLWGDFSLAPRTACGVVEAGLWLQVSNNAGFGIVVIGCQAALLSSRQLSHNLTILSGTFEQKRSRAAI